MLFLRQVWVLARKDLLIFRRRWKSTLLRALILPIVYTFVLAYIKYWTATPGQYGVGAAAPIMDFGDALAQSTARPNVIIIDNGFKTGDISQVVQNLSTTIKNSGKDLHILPDSSQLTTYCPSSNAGVSYCYGAVEFLGSPDHGTSKQWNYTLFSDYALGARIDVSRTNNDIQVYLLPFQHAINSLIAKATPDGPQLPASFMQYPFTGETEAQKEQRDAQQYQDLVQGMLAFAFFIGLSGLIYHLAGHVAYQREQGMLALIDAMMPVSQKWKCVCIRMVATHLAFDLVYLPSWVGMGGLVKIAFPNTNVGYLIMIYLFAGFATTSFSVLAGSLFRKAQLSGIAGIITALALALAAQFGEEPAELFASLAGAISTGVLFSPSTFVYLLMITSFFEAEGGGLNLSKSFTVPETDSPTWSASAGIFLVFLVIQIVLYPIIAVIIEHRLHGTDSSGRKVIDGSGMAGSSVRIQSFSKEFKSRTNKKSMVQAVNNLSLELHGGTITVLLGANGSGKSTTLTSIAGLQKVDAGTIEIDGTGGLGICPQKNILWDQLTVEEHVDLFDLLKATTSQTQSDREHEITRLIDGCDLTIKRGAQAKTLSGGQKRKLQLAIMLAGGSHVCCVDEATSGIDPIARRKIWDILMAERGKRSILLTTHFLDEAEVLSDYVVVLSKGTLKAQGSVAALKAQLGGGFKVLLGDNSKDIDVPHIPDVRRTSDYNRAMFICPDSKGLASLIETLDRSHIPALRQYTIHGPTLEEIFLGLSEEMQGDSDLARELTVSNPSDQHAHEGTSTEAGRRDLVLETGQGCSPVQQTGILFQKRLTILKHNYMPYVAALFVPLVAAGMVTRMFIDFQYQTGLQCSDPSQERDYSYVQYLQPYNIMDDGFIYGPPNRISPSQLQSLVPTATSASNYYYGGNGGNSALGTNWATQVSIPTATSLPDFDSAIKNAEEDTFMFGGFYADPNAPTIAWAGGEYGEGPLSAVGLQSLAESYLMNQTLNVGYQTFAQSFTPSDGITIMIAVLSILGFAIYPGFFALYPTAERLRHVRAMQYSNGIKSSSLWIAYALFDLIFILTVSVLTVAIWASQWQGWYGLSYLFVVLFLYGLAATAFSYVISLVVSSQLAAFAYAGVIQVIIVMSYFTGYAIASAEAPVDQVYPWFNYIHYTIALICPAASLLRGLLMVLNNYSLACAGDHLASYPGAFNIYGAPILYLTIQFFLLAAFLMFWESGRSLEVFGIHFRRHQKETSRDVEKAGRHASSGSEASEDTIHMAASNDGLRVAHLTKSFRSTQAVDDVTFGILPSEKFALLGPNGAGKSTTISLIRGDLKPDRGSDSSVYIGNNSLYQTPVAAKNQLGVCPQFDATDTMTLREHLVFYARARGVPNRNKNINELLTRLGLTEHADKRVKKLSGGTHRKLSLAIALLANPRCLLLDEPSSGMDPAAKRALWRTLRQTAAGRVLLLTTHSMEEAAALCDRAGIIAGQLLALGTIDQLRHRYGPAACVHLVHRSAPHATAEETFGMREWVTENFPTAELEERTFGGQVRFWIPRTNEVESDHLIGRLFRKVEEAREDLGIVDYSIGPATLDQVFLDVIQAHGVQEENTNGGPPGAPRPFKYTWGKLWAKV